MRGLDRGASRKIRAIKAAFLPGSDVNCIIVTRSEIEAYALARVKQHSQGGSWSGIENHFLS